MTITVGIIEDDKQLGAVFESLVNEPDDMACVGRFTSAEEALARLPALAPDAVLMDINLPGMNGIECTARLKAALPALNILMLTAFDDSDSVFESLKAGATGYILKRAYAGEIRSAIRDIVAGGAPMSGAIARKVVGFFGYRREAPEVQMLTERERAVLHALAEGQQYKEIADLLGVTINTVRKHIRSIYDKLHVHSRSEAVRKLGA